MTDTTQAKAVVARAVDELFNRGELAAADALFAGAYAQHERRFTELARAAFPDLELTVEQQVAEGDLVATRWRATGTHTGPFLGLAPTGRRATWTGVWLQRVAGGRIAEGQDWGVWDRAGLLDQLRADGGAA